MSNLSLQLVLALSEPGMLHGFFSGRSLSWVNSQQPPHKVHKVLVLCLQSVLQCSLLRHQDMDFELIVWAPALMASVCIRLGVLTHILASLIVLLSGFLVNESFPGEEV